MATIEQRNYFKIGDQIEFFSPYHENVVVPVTKTYIMKIMEEVANS
ncbi:MAG: U32 family peptidase C-terminal domain-containing protein [Thomasclavelia ramosa]